jgi:hypothetical protein
MLHHVALVRTIYDIVFLHSVLWLLVTAKVVPSSPILVTLMMEVICSSKTAVLKEPRGVTYQKMAFLLLYIPHAEKYTVL